MIIKSPHFKSNPIKSHHSRTKLVVTFNVWSLCIAFCLGIKGGVENVPEEKTYIQGFVNIKIYILELHGDLQICRFSILFLQVEVGQGGFVGGLVARIWKEEATSERVPEKKHNINKYF